jgi:hypothetical protein
MAKFVDYDPGRGIETWEDSYEGKLQVHYRQDVEPILELNKIERINGLTDYGIKQDMWLYARIAAVIILKLKYEYGIDIFDKNHMKRAADIINREYPYLKCTEKHHELKH